MFFQYNKLIEQNNVPDISIFCWTEPYRLYHPELILSANTEPLEGVDPNVYKTLDNYWKYLHNYDKDEMAYEYAIKHYDQNVLSKVGKQIAEQYPDLANGIEVTDDVFESPACIAFEQAENRMHTIKAILVSTLADL